MKKIISEFKYVLYYGMMVGGIDFYISNYKRTMSKQEEFNNAVELMRLAQNAYFKNRTKENLIAARNLEYVVDGLLKKLKSTQSIIPFHE